MKRGILMFIAIDLMAGVCIAVFLWFRLGTVPPAFDYATASKAERAQWLDAQARAFAADVAASLPEPGEQGVTMAVAETSVNAARRQIDVVVQVASPMQMTDALYAMKQDLIARRCPDYAQSDLGRNEIYLFETYRHGTDEPALTLGVTPIVCREYL